MQGLGGVRARLSGLPGLQGPKGLAAPRMGLLEAQKKTAAIISPYPWAFDALGSSPGMAFSDFNSLGTNISGGTGYQASRSTTALPSGVVSTFSIRMGGAITESSIGIGNAAQNNTDYIGHGNDGIGFYADGRVFLNNVDLASPGLGLFFANGDLLEVEWNDTTKQIRCRRNGGAYNGPWSAAGINAGPYYRWVTVFHNNDTVQVVT